MRSNLLHDVMPNTIDSIVHFFVDRFPHGFQLGTRHRKDRRRMAHENVGRTIGQQNDKDQVASDVVLNILPNEPIALCNHRVIELQKRKLLSRDSQTQLIVCELFGIGTRFGVHDPLLVHIVGQKRHVVGAEAKFDFVLLLPEAGEPCWRPRSRRHLRRRRPRAVAVAVAARHCARSGLRRVAILGEKRGAGRGSGLEISHRFLKLHVTISGPPTAAEPRPTSGLLGGGLVVGLRLFAPLCAHLADRRLHRCNLGRILQAPLSNVGPDLQPRDRIRSKLQQQRHQLKVLVKQREAQCGQPFVVLNSQEGI
mmetsp:Transcript_5898/g.22414  ORF Transcript_5898/g.22414 Transcript_5898/m.22414 type:complete len:310 (+) Transcript_5898:2238-3167(+)